MRIDVVRPAKRHNFICRKNFAVVQISEPLMTVQSFTSETPITQKDCLLTLREASASCRSSLYLWAFAAFQKGLVLGMQLPNSLLCSCMLCLQLFKLRLQGEFFVFQHLELLLFLGFGTCCSLAVAQNSLPGSAHPKRSYASPACTLGSGSIQSSLRIGCNTHPSKQSAGFKHQTSFYLGVSRSRSMGLNLAPSCSSSCMAGPGLGCRAAKPGGTPIRWACATCCSPMPSSDAFIWGSISCVPKRKEL